MKKEFLCLLAFIAAYSMIFPQQSELSTLTGKVVDSITKDGLPGVSVYLSGTTIGASSDKNGNYKIGKVPAGKYIIVVSMIGYKPLVQNVVLNGSSNIQKNFSLENKPIEMNAVIVADHSDEYDAYFKEVLNFRESFKKYFLGQTDFSKECRIENIEEIIFDKKFEPNIEAKCASPIIVINMALGYKIECALLNFIFNNSVENVSCEFYPKLIELIPEDESQKLKWNKNRKSAFVSSLRRFLISQMQSNVQLNDYGFTIPRASSFFKNLPHSSFADAREKIARVDSASGFFFLKFKGYLFVNNFLTEEQSLVYLPFGTAYLESDGFPIDPSSIQLFGAFAKQGVANLLPTDVSYREWEENNK